MKLFDLLPRGGQAQATNCIIVMSKRLSLSNYKHEGKKVALGEN
jgi:hypothetical protein